MKKFDVDRLTGTRFLDITSENFRPIFLPIFISIVIFVGGVVLFLLTQNRIVFKVLFGLTGVAMAISGLGQIRLRMVPGFPSLRGGCAVIFGLAFFFMFFILGIIVIFLINCISGKWRIYLLGSNSFNAIFPACRASIFCELILKTP